ncbi:MAG TPA: arsenate reductase (glutaredoxin) [Acidimicrobiales bacterium]|nr:arsenate reductase (glutaredoxin) [Acidimicrobiales bacterium]
MDPALYYNPSCSKCRTADALLHERGIEAEHVRYLDRAPTGEELRRLMGMLGIDDPRLMMRTGEPLYAELGLGGASAEQLLEALSAHPILLERPIFVVGERAVIARPPERVLELL